MNLDEKMKQFKKEIINAKNIHHVHYIIERYFNNDLSLRKKKKLFYLTLQEIKKERKNKREEYLKNKQKLKQSEKADLLKEETFLKEKVRILKLYCEEIQIHQKKENYKLEHIREDVNPKNKSTQQQESFSDLSIDDISYIHNPRSKHYLSCMETKEEFVIQDLDEFLLAYKYFVRHYNLLEYHEVIMKYTNQLLEQLSTLEEERFMIELTSIIDNIKYKKAEYKDKENLNVKLEKEILKQIKKEFRKSYRNVKKVKDFHDYRIDILEYLIYHEGNYYHIKKLIEYIPEMINLRSKEDEYLFKNSISVEKSNQKDEHILVKIIKLFAYHLEIELRSQDPDFINRDYYKKLYFLLQKRSVLLTEEDQKEIDDTLDRLFSHLKNNRYEEKRKAKAMMDILEIRENINSTKENRKNVIPDQLENEIAFLEYRKEKSLQEEIRANLTSKYLSDVHDKVESLKQQNPNISNRELAKELGVKVHDITNSFLFSDTIMLAGKNVAYSICQDEEYNYYFRIHTLDMTSCIEEDSMLSQDLYNTIYGDKKSRFLKYFKMKKQEIIPTITYQFKVMKNGYVSNFQMFFSQISIDQVYTDEDLQNYRSNESLKRFVQIYRLIHQNNHSRITIDAYHQLFSNLVSENIFHYIYQNNLPMIIKGKNEISDFDYLRFNSELGYLLSKLDYKTYHKVFHVIASNMDEYHYSIEGFQGNNSINILDNLNYEHFINQLIIKEIIKQTDKDKIIERYAAICQEAITSLNDSLGYVSIPSQNKTKNLK